MYYLDTNEHVIEGAIFSSPGQRPSEFLPSLGIRLSVRPSIVRRKLVDLAVLIIFTPCQISDIINGF
jgi:hypothetical protein